MNGRALAVQAGWRVLGAGIGTGLGVLYASLLGCHGS